MPYSDVASLADMEDQTEKHPLHQVNFGNTCPPKVVLGDMPAANDTNPQKLVNYEAELKTHHNRLMVCLCRLVCIASDLHYYLAHDDNNAPVPYLYHQLKVC